MKTLPLAAALALAAVVLATALLAFAGGSGEAFPGTNGRIAYTRQLEVADGWGEIFSMNADGSDEVNLTNAAGYDEDPAWSPDGSMIAWVKRPGDGSADIWLMNADGSHQRNLTNSPAYDTSPAWSPDGQKIIFVSDFRITVVPIAGGQPQVLGEETDEMPAWSPDGGRIAFVRNVSGVRDVFVMNADGTGAVNVTNDSDSIDLYPAWSPDGSHLTFLKSRGAQDIFVSDACGRDLTALTTDGRSGIPAWSPDGAKIVFDHSPFSGPIEIWVANVSGGEGERIATTEGASGFADWQPVIVGSPAPLSPAAVDCPAPSPTPGGLPDTGGRP